MNKKAIIEELDAIANGIERKGVAIFYPILVKQGKEIALLTSLHGIDFAKAATPHTLGNDIQKGMIEFYQYGGLISAKWQYNKFKTGYKSLFDGIGSFLKQWLMELQMYVYTDLALMVQNINDTTAQQIQRILDDAQTNGYGKEKAARLIVDATSGDIAKARALTIARTEGTRAASKGHKLAAAAWKKQTGQNQYKQWIPIIDNRTRPDHAEMDDTPPIPEEDKFNVGGNGMEAPGDVTAPANETINCRCRAVYLTESMVSNL